MSGVMLRQSTRESSVMLRQSNAHERARTVTRQLRHMRERERERESKNLTASRMLRQSKAHEKATKLGT